MQEQIQIFLESSQQFLNEIARAVPQIIGALLILLVGWLIAKLVKRIFIKFLKIVKLNWLTEKAGIEKFLKEGGLKITAIDLIGSLVYWIIMLRGLLLIKSLLIITQNC